MKTLDLANQMSTHPSELNEATGARTMDSLVDQDFAAAELELQCVSEHL